MSCELRLGVDASNIQAGGGKTHLIEFLGKAQPDKYGFKQVTVWGGQKTLQFLPNKPWLSLVYDSLLDGNLFQRVAWQLLKLPKQAKRVCDILFVPGGINLGGIQPFVTFSQNLLPFDVKERQRYGLSSARLRYRLLEIGQKSSFRRAKGVIFLTETAQEIVEQRIGSLPGKTVVIPHGIADDFRLPPRQQRPLADGKPFRWLYVSVVNLYKHQWNVVEALASLRQEGFSVMLDLIGPAYPPALERLRQTINKYDPSGKFIFYHGPVPYNQLPAHYHQADGFIFASSCETFGQILVEAMSTGLPIACSNRGAMPETLRECGIYFDPEKPNEIAEALRFLMVNPALREQLAGAAFERSRLYSWERCADETFSFFASVVQDYREKQAQIK